MRRVLEWIFGILALALIAAIAFVGLRNRSGARKAEAEFVAHQPSPIGGFGTTRTLSILPLIDWHTSSPELRAEAGVSYLIETDEHRILFDVGYNAKQESPSPLELNMKALTQLLNCAERLMRKLVEAKRGRLYSLSASRSSTWKPVLPERSSSIGSPSPGRPTLPFNAESLVR